MSFSLMTVMGWLFPPGSRFRLRSIKGKVFIVFAVTFLAMAILTGLNFWNLGTIKEHLLLGERYDDLLNNILEVRRFEKNYLYFDTPDSLKESLIYLGRIDNLTEELGDDLVIVAGQASVANFRKTLHRYEQLLNTFVAKKEAHREELRSLGKSLTEFADRSLKTKRARIHKAILFTSILPIPFFITFLLLMFLVIKLISTGLLKPLDLLKATTNRVGRGDFGPIDYQDNRLEEVSQLIEAFNRMAQELETNQEDLLQARKIAALGTFTAGIAHELNNPINNISLTAESFYEDYGDRVDKDGTEMLRDILAQSERAADIVKNLLDFSRTEHPSFSYLHAEDVIESTVRLLKNQVTVSGLRLKVVIAPDLPPIHGNLRSLQQVFMNLLLNAIQATPKGGLIRFSAELQEPHSVRFEVCDSGDGVPAEIRQQIFEPFFSTKEVSKGTGLGLAVTYSLVKRHNGHIDVSDAPEGGAVFSVVLPAKENDDMVAKEQT